MADEGTQGDSMAKGFAMCVLSLLVQRTFFFMEHNFVKIKSGGLFDSKSNIKH